MTEFTPTTQAVLGAAYESRGLWDDPVPVIVAAAPRAVVSNAKFRDTVGLTAYGGFCLLRDQLEEIATELESRP